MHEMSLAEGILHIVEEAAVREGFSRVQVVHVALGRLACVDEAALSFCFEAVMKDSLADGARLQVHMQPGTGRCQNCDAVFAMEDLLAACPACGSYRVDITSGQELRVMDLEVI